MSWAEVEAAALVYGAATTDTAKLVEAFADVAERPGLKVVFSTYQSIDVVARGSSLYQVGLVRRGGLTGGRSFR